ncbi:MAG: methionyl-tRNA formyltransferase [Planctomycetota bacterium]|nr:methionyl-tRNA formyltransferase [Planctomycetota bacterium]
MRIVFCGTPDYAVPSLRRLVQLAPRHEVVAVVSQPDRPKGRSHTPAPPPVVAAARSLGIPPDRIFQPRSINSPDVLARLKALSPDLLCVVAYGGLLKRDALALPRLRAINAHGSLLPRHRGAAPIQAALLAGDAETGVSIMEIELALDAGPVLLKRPIPIQPDDDAGTLHDKLAGLSAECFAEAVALLEAGIAVFTPQDATQASYAPKLGKDAGRIDWSGSVDFLLRFVRAMNPWPGAWTAVRLPDGSRNMRLRVVSAERGAGVRPSFRGQGGAVCGAGCQPATIGAGHVGRAGDEAVIVVGCGDGGFLAVRQLQPEGKRPMSSAEFLRGAGRAFADDSRWE